MYALSFAHGDFTSQYFFSIQGQHNTASPISVWLECIGKKLAQGLLKAASDRRHNLSFGPRCFSVAWPVASTATTYSTPADEAWPNRQSYSCFCIPANLANSAINNGQPAYSISQADPADQIPLLNNYTAHSNRKAEIPGKMLLLSF